LTDGAVVAPSAWLVQGQQVDTSQLVSDFQVALRQLVETSSERLAAPQALAHELAGRGSVERSLNDVRRHTLKQLGLELERVRSVSREERDRASDPLQVKVITAASISRNETELAEVQEHLLDTLPVVEPGDVLLLPTHGVLKTFVWEGELARFTSSLWHVVRTGLSDYDPYFIAAGVQASGTVALIARDATIPRVNARELSVPVASAEQQRLYGAALREVALARAGAQKALAASGQVLESITALVDAAAL